LEKGGFDESTLAPVGRLVGSVASAGS
jgi:hypothetical protein